LPVDTINTATDLYYNITKLNNKLVVIANTAGAILSITNVKVTYDNEHVDNVTKSFFTINNDQAQKAVISVQGVFSQGEEDDNEVNNGPIDLKSATLSFEDEILINLYYTVSDAEVTEMGLLTWDAEPENGTLDNAQKIYQGAVYDEVKGRYMLHTDGIAAKNLGDTIYMRVYAKTADGIIYSDVTSYSPKQYALSRLEKSTDANMKALCVAMLNYGAAAQEYFGYKTDDLMNAALTAEQKAVSYDSALFAGAAAADQTKIGSFTRTDGFSKRTATVSFEGAFAINYYFTPSDNVSGDVTFYYWTAEDYAEAETLSADNASGTCTMAIDGDRRFAQIQGIAAKDLDTTYYVAAVYQNNAGVEYCTGVIAYSLSQYCMNNANGNMGELAQATAMYGYYAACYFNKEA
jgi:hypothetical protein